MVFFYLTKGKKKMENEEVKVVEIVVLADGQQLIAEKTDREYGKLVIHLANADMNHIESIMTKDNLQNVQITTEAGIVYGRFYNLKAISMLKNLESGILAVALKAENDLEVRIREVEDGQMVQDGAIADLGEVIGGE